DFARWLAAIQTASGEEVETSESDGAGPVRQSGWRAVRDLELSDPLKAFDAWNELGLGAAAAHDRFLKVQTDRALTHRGWSIAWRIAPRYPAGSGWPWMRSPRSASGSQRVSR